MKPISVYALNLPKRQDRLQSILQQSRGKSEFDFKRTAIIKIIGNDLFHQISNRKYIVNGQGQVETIYNRPPNYIMVSIGCRFDSITK